MSCCAMAYCTRPRSRRSAFCGSAKRATSPAGLASRGKSSAGMVCSVKRLFPALTSRRLSCCCSVTSAPSGSARRISTSFLAPTVTALASPEAASELRAVIWISMSVARNETDDALRSMRTLDRMGSVWRRSMIPLTAESGPRISSRLALTRTIVIYLYVRVITTNSGAGNAG